MFGEKKREKLTTRNELKKECKKVQKDSNDANEIEAQSMQKPVFTPFDITQNMLIRSNSGPVDLNAEYKQFTPEEITNSVLLKNEITPNFCKDSPQTQNKRDKLSPLPQTKMDELI